jgi:hypothetical protein
MQDVLFATVLFVAYFSFVCCLLSERTSVKSPLSAQPQSEEVASSAIVENLWDDQPITMASALGTEVDPEPEVELEMSDKRNPEPTLEELLEGIDLDSLQLRPVRKICGRLGIQQKVNGKDAPLSWLRSQIKSRLSEKPTEVGPIIQEVLKAA